MECPFCAKPMEHGYIQSRMPVIWCPKKKYGPLMVPGNPGDIGVTGEGLGGCFADAWLCRSCGRLIVKPNESVIVS